MTVVEIQGGVCIGPFATPEAAAVWAKNTDGIEAVSLRVLVSPEGWQGNG